MNWQSNVTHKPLNVAQRAKSQIYQLFIKIELQLMNRVIYLRVLMTKLLEDKDLEECTLCLQFYIKNLSLNFVLNTVLYYYCV